MIIPQNTNEIQVEITQFLQDMPVILVDNKSSLYFLVKELNEELEAFLKYGKTEGCKYLEFQVFSKEREKELTDSCKQAGLIIKHHHHQMEFMKKVFTITYPQISSPGGGMAVSLIPWFMFPDRPYPIFVYLYANWYYLNTGQTSLAKSAKVTGELFGIDSLNKSTVCRSLKAFSHFLDLSQADRPLFDKEFKPGSDKDLIERIPEILRRCPSIESLKEEYQDKIKSLPEPINNRDNKDKLAYALNGIPKEYLEVTKETGQTVSSKKCRDMRVRPPRTRKKRKKPVQRSSESVDPQKIIDIRTGFIETCKRIVLNTAATYHQFLL